MFFFVYVVICWIWVNFLLYFYEDYDVRYVNNEKGDEIIWYV